LVLVEYALPVMNGGIVAKAMKAQHSPSALLMVSGGEVPNQHLSICEGHVHKADGPELLLRTIRELLFPASSPVVERSQKAS
jgi:hypothetical protein